MKRLFIAAGLALWASTAGAQYITPDYSYQMHQQTLQNQWQTYQTQLQTQFQAQQLMESAERQRLFNEQQRQHQELMRALGYR